MAHEYEFYETPRTFTRYLFTEMYRLGHPILGTVFEPCVGSRAIIEAVEEMAVTGLGDPWRVQHWLTNDLDPRWPAQWHSDATASEVWQAADRWARDVYGFGMEWTVSNPPFTPAIDIITAALSYSRVGVAMHLRISIHEVLKTGVRRTWMAKHPPTALLFLPRFAYQRSKKTGLWTTDSASACWAIWMKDPAVPQFIRYAPEQVIDELDQETPHYRKRMDALMAERRVA